MNNSSLLKCKNNPTKDFLNTYFDNFLNIFGIVANGLCIIIFIKILKRSKCNMFKFLLMKSLSDFLYSISNIFRYFYYCSNCRTSSSYLIQVWYIWFYIYFENFLETLSAIFEISATFVCYTTINLKLKCCQNIKFFYVWCIIVILTNFIIHLIYPLSYVIKKTTALTSNYSYYNDFNEFGYSALIIDAKLVILLVKGCFFIIILIILNVLIIITLKRSTERRRALNGTDLSLIISLKAERKKMLMIIALGMNYLIGPFSFFIFTLLFTFYDPYIYCYDEYFILFYFLTYTDSIFFYFFFNNVFRRFLLDLIPFYNRNI
jgi:hypothetical protein